MAEHLMQPPTERMSAFDAMGKPISPDARQRGYDTCKEMGLTDSARAWECVSGMAAQLQRDKPYEAVEVGMRFLDLTGTYRLMAVLLTEPPAKPMPVKREPFARMLRETPGVLTIWHVEVPAPGGKVKLYKATTYPQSDLMYLETTGERPRAVAPLAARNITPEIRAAIEKARAATAPGEPA
jgi:hypothetical protein